MYARAAILTLTLPGIIVAQAMVENAIISGAGANSAAPIRWTGKAIGSAAQTVSKTLEPETASKSSKRGRRSARTVPPRIETPVEAEAKAEASFEDPSAIPQGLEYEELVRRFGPPSLQLTTGPADATLSYVSNQKSVGVIMHNGKVASVRKAGG
jgi:hypothetical protein